MSSVSEEDKMYPLGLFYPLIYDDDGGGMAWKYILHHSIHRERLRPPLMAMKGGGGTEEDSVRRIRCTPGSLLPSHL